MMIHTQFGYEDMHYLYPIEYRGLGPINEQADRIAEYLRLSLDYTSEWIEKVMPTTPLPNGAEGWGAIPSVDAVAKRHFPKVIDPSKKYVRAVKMILELLGKYRPFNNDYPEILNHRNFRQCAHTIRALNIIAKKQKGDILIIPVQFGITYIDCPVRLTRLRFRENEFGLGTLAVGSLALTHPDRYVDWQSLHTDCPGDEVALNNTNNNTNFNRSTMLLYHNKQIKLSISDISRSSGRFGSVTGFIP